ncbi:MAG: ACR3 family arsenite transporter [bacterium]|jgi:ACR3 family arsenite transporter
MIIQLLAYCGRYGRWVLPLGLVAGVLLPWAAAPMRVAIPGCIAVLLFLAVIRLFPNSVAVSEGLPLREWCISSGVVLISQLLLPLLVYTAGLFLRVPSVWLLAATLVAAAPPISGSPNLVMLLRGDGNMAMRWLMVGTALLPLSCIPILYLLFPGQSASTMIRPSSILLSLIVGSVALAILALRFSKKQNVEFSSEALDGASAIVLAVMVIGLMSAVHKPDTTMVAIGEMLLLATFINVGLQTLGVVTAKLFESGRSATITQGVVLGNRNIALYLTALPAAQIEPLLLFIACYQVPMYLTPLIGDVFYRRLE